MIIISLLPALGQPVSHILRNDIRAGNTQTGRNQNSGAGPPTSTSGQSGQGASAASAVTALCNNDERRMVFRSCVLPYVQEHRGYIQYLSSRPVCQAEVFSCSRTDQLVQCLNSLSISKVSNQCWPVVPHLLGSIFKLYRVPCTFNDIKKQCRDTQDLSTAEKRSQQQASGLNGSPQQNPTANFHPRPQGVGGSNPAPQQGDDLNNGPQLGSGMNRMSQSRGGLNNSPQRGRGLANSPQSAPSGGTGPSVNQVAQDNESAAALGLTPYCSGTEMNLVFQRCARRYGYAHFRYLSFLRSQPTCRAETFSCG
ncbi:hypothetical protein BaRGS_00006823 [Batillaria attramentaria]|uniref:FZ domain-containing protein n=1 Tax=Batillaria attramentaria TaxID=370345 RepID=A0ABD0LSD2_9CAEN